MTSTSRPAGASPLRPFRHRGFATVWTGSFVSNIGTWMETVAVGVYVTQTTGQAAWTGTVAALTYVPTVLLGPIGGALADRFDRRRFLAGVTLFQTLLAGTLALLAATGSLSLAAVAVIVLLAGCAFAVYMPTFSAITPDLVPAEDLLGAMSLGAAQWNLGRVVGPALAGIVITAGGLSWAFGLNTVSFAGVLVALALVRVPAVRRPEGPRPRLWANIAVGARAARQDEGIRTALLLLLATTFLVSPFIGLVPAVAIKVFHAGAGGTSALVTAQGVGAVLSALAATPLAARLGRRRLLVCALFAVGPAAALYGLAPRFPLAVAGIGVLGFCYLAVLSGTSTVCQARAPRELRARIASLFMLAVGGGHASGLVIQGWLGDRVGLPVVTAATGLALLGTVTAVRLLRPAWMLAMDTSAEPQPTAEPPADPLLPPDIDLQSAPAASLDGAAASLGGSASALDGSAARQDGSAARQDGRLRPTTNDQGGPARPDHLTEPTDHPS